MIFATVGTHEQPFDRLVEAVDKLAYEGEKIVQYGYSNYQPINCISHQFLPFDVVRSYVTDAEVVITHAGTGSVMLALSLGKRPIVAPRYKKNGEHVDDHQLQLLAALELDGLIIPFRDGERLELRVHEALRARRGARPISPDQRLIGELHRLIIE